MCRALMPGDEESMSDEAIWETLPVSFYFSFVPNLRCPLAYLPCSYISSFPLKEKKIMRMLNCFYIF